MPIDTGPNSEEGRAATPKVKIPPDVNWAGWATLPGLALSVANAVAVVAGRNSFLNPHWGRLLPAIALGSFWLGHLWLAYIAGLIVKNAAKGMLWKLPEVALAFLILLGVLIVHLAARKAFI